MRVAIVTNIPAPYRLPMYERLAALPGIELELFFCSGREPDREWDLARLGVPHSFLRERLVTWRGRFIHINPDVWAKLRAFAPEVVITTGFNPTHLLAFAFARMHGARHVAMTDGTAQSEAKLTFVHRWIRRRVYHCTHAFVGASEGSFALYRQYGVPATALFKSHLCANNEAYAAASSQASREFDFIFCGRFVPGKLPLFAIEVAAATAQRLGRRVRLLLVGSGELDAAMRLSTDRVAEQVDAHFTGFARQAELPGHYARARLLLFPTVGDTWGVVANEACAAGLAVIVSPQAGVAGELVREGINGHVLPLDATLWADAAAKLLSDADGWGRMSRRSLDLVAPYTYANAAQGLADAVGHDAAQLRSAAVPSGPVRRRVVLVQRRMTHYRVPLFERMRATLGQRGIDLDVIHGDPMPGEALKGDGGRLAWAQHVPSHYVLGGRLCWQWAWPVIRGADLVIVTQENKLLLNHVLQAFRFLVPLALWGHGRNFQSHSVRGMRERLKRLLVPRSDWWFAYTEASADIVRGLGFAPERITVLNNAVDTVALAAELHALRGTGDAALRSDLGLQDGPVGLMLGSLYADKGVAFVLDAARRVRAQIADFQLLIVGDGPERALVESAVGADSWMHWAGVCRGRDKARCLRVASIVIAPFGIGLVVLDSFVAGAPMVATASHGHGPEFAYLKHGVNCVIASPEPQACAADVVALLQDEPRRTALARAGVADALGLTVDHMAERFCDGIAQCLDRHARIRTGVAA
jgi:glycosyltransferase involved in cell wall biosynthesis